MKEKNVLLQRIRALQSHPSNEMNFFGPLLTETLIIIVQNLIFYKKF